MLVIRCKNGSVWEVKPDTSITFVDTRIQFISALSNRFIKLLMIEVDSIYNQ